MQQIERAISIHQKQQHGIPLPQPQTEQAAHQLLSQEEAIALPFDRANPDRSALGVTASPPQSKSESAIIDRILSLDLPE
jgi:hypothetical protein